MEKQFTTFYLGEERFGIDVLLVKEINRNLDITEVAGAPEYIRGMLNLRGQIVTVMDLAVRFGREPSALTPLTSCMVLKTNSDLIRVRNAGGELDDETGLDSVGLLVDQIGDMITIEKRDIAPPPANQNGVSGKFLSGIIRLDDELIVTLKAEPLLETSV